MITSFLVSIAAGFIAVDAVVVKEKRQTAVVPPTTKAAIYAQNYRGFQIGGTCKADWVYACSDTNNVIRCGNDLKWILDGSGDCISKKQICGYPALGSGVANPYCVDACKALTVFSGYLQNPSFPRAICSTDSNQNYCYDTKKWVNFSNDTSNCGGCGKIVPSGDTCCSGIARNLQNDVANCGACGRLAVYDNHSANTCCNGRGIDIQNDKDHCGACNRPASLDNLNADKCCGGRGKNTRNDTDHCGDCFKSVALQTPGGDMCCSGVAINTQNDTANCGECGKSMTQWRSDADMCCSGQGANTKTDSNNCGGCGNEVGAKGGDKCCNGNIINTKENSSHCGGCDQKCTSGGSPGCCGGKCKDLSVNSKHCGKCDVDCGEEQYCLSSLCHQPASCKEFKDGNVCSNSVDKDTNVFSEL
ncbi:hypothetical protein BCR33DRAFT_765521 [Rhizoclosmatium globosum]|uniref:Uncharacterized protein n=1 Tax=Rhizoclosmatium globosum TaxID=329046 RepID=A0A1Y2CDC3_9FUNG|nr:hypothetical protein BCR33DRAFT_765521 [Rhizoclosmatium globosum]|eukprot:ORY45048.1 hypothetical protein BCR33DRAFT_765521 [Rhizoclosmatium globosum]